MVAFSQHNAELNNAGPTMADSDILDFDTDQVKAGTLMKSRRETLGMSQSAVGDSLEPRTPWRTIAKWEKGLFKPKSPRREQIAELLGLRLPGQDIVATGAPLIDRLSVSEPVDVIETSLVRAQEEIDRAMGALVRLKKK